MLSISSTNGFYRVDVGNKVANIRKVKLSFSLRGGGTAMFSERAAQL